MSYQSIFSTGKVKNLPQRDFSQDFNPGEYAKVNADIAKNSRPKTVKALGNTYTLQNNGSYTNQFGEKRSDSQIKRLMDAEKSFRQQDKRIAEQKKNIASPKAIAGDFIQVGKNIGSGLTSSYKRIGEGNAEILNEITGGGARARNQAIQSQKETDKIVDSLKKRLATAKTQSEKDRLKKGILAQLKIAEGQANSNIKTQQQIAERTNPIKAAGSLASIGLDVVTAGEGGTLLRGGNKLLQTGRLAKNAKNAVRGTESGLKIGSDKAIKASDIVTKGTAIGAGYGAAGTAEEKGEKAKPGDYVKNSLTGAAIGTALAGIPAVGVLAKDKVSGVLSRITKKPEKSESIAKQPEQSILEEAFPGKKPDIVKRAIESSKAQSQVASEFSTTNKIPKTEQAVSSKVSSVKKQPISSTDSLKQEATKYDNVDDFIKAKGEPLYHGTNAEFDKFDINKQQNSGWLSKGFYFTKNADEAKGYGKNVKERYLTLEKPLKLEQDKINPDNTVTFAKSTKEQIAEKFPETKDMKWGDVANYLESKGYDGVDNGTNVVAFSPNKIISKDELRNIWEDAHSASSKEAPLQKGDTISGNSLRIQQKAVEKKLTDNFGDLPQYKSINIKEQAQEAVNLVKNDKQKAIDIIEGKANPEGNLRAQSVHQALEDVATREGDAELLRKLANSHINTELSEGAQRLRIAAERDPHSPVELMRQVKDARIKAAKKSSDSISKVKSSIKNSVKSVTPKQTKETWDSFISGLEC